MKALITKSVLAAALVLGSVGVASADDWKLGVKVSKANGGGQYVHEVFAGSPAELAGLQAGYTILAINGVMHDDPLAMRDFIMNGNAPSLDVIYTDGSGFYQVTAQLEVVTTYAFVMEGGKKVEKAEKKLAVKKLNRVEVADPRKAAKPADPKAKAPTVVRKEVKDPRK